MKLMKCAVALVVLLGAAAPQLASADRGHWRGHGGRTHLGISIGVPLYWGWPDPFYPYPPPYAAYPPYYGYPPVIAVPSSPPVYIEREDEAGPTRDEDYWYYCDKPAGYYPYVRNCPGGWERVPPRPSR